MKSITHRLLSLLLSAALVLTLLPPGGARAAGTEEGGVTGSISATLRIDYAQTLDALAAREVEAELRRGGTSLGSVRMAEPGEYTLSSQYTAVVSARNSDGGDLQNGWPGYLDLTVHNLPTGEYTLRFTGKGYVAAEVAVELKTHARHVILGTGDATFTLGDFDGNDRVTEKDREALSEALGSTDSEDLARYDLNGDGAVDIVDLAYVNRQLEAEGGAEVLSTALLAPPVNLQHIRDLMLAAGVTVAGDLKDLFVDNAETVRLTRPENGGNIVLPMPLEDTAELQSLRITAPEGEAPLAGTVVVEDEQGKEHEYSFDLTPPEGAHAIGRSAEKKVITIDLGSRIPVKKITVTVTKTEEEGYAVLELVEFLQDIVPENPVPSYSEVKRLSAQAGDEEVSLDWEALPNVSGYRVAWWPADGSEEVRTTDVDVNRAEVTGLDNYVPYQFTVTPIDGGWTGRASQPVTATPEPASAPTPPEMVTVAVMDGALAVSWKAIKTATFYEIYYTDQQGAAFADYICFADDLTSPSATIDGLENGTEYFIRVTAGNDMGVSAPSTVYAGIPKAVDYSMPEGIPEAGRLDSSKIKSIRLADQNNVDRSAYTAAAPFKAENIIDGDLRTHWTASTSWSRDEHVVCTFTEPVDLSTAIWIPRRDGQFPTNLRAYSFRVWYEGDELSGPGRQMVPNPASGISDSNNAQESKWPNVPNYSSANGVANDGFAIMPLGNLEDVIQISIAAEQRAYTQISCAELLFLEYDPEKNLPDDIAGLFKNELHDALQEGVTKEQIAGYRQRLESEEGKYYLYRGTLADELKLAEALLESSGGDPAGSVILRGVESRSSGADSTKYSQGGSDLQPLGVAARAGQEITIYAQGIPEGGSLAVCATQFNGEVSAWKASMGTLVNGRNVLVLPEITGRKDVGHGGSLYFTYSGANPEGISLHVRQATDIPVLDVSGWYNMNETERGAAIGAYVAELEAYVSAIKVSDANKTSEYRNVTEIATPTVLLSLPALAALNGLGTGNRDAKIAQLTNSVLAWEDLLHICKTTQGIDKTYEHNDMQSRQNIRCMTMFTGAFMYAAGSHVGIGYSSCQGMVGGKPIAKLGTDAKVNDLFGWGIAHEIGHNMDKLGKAEITNNLYALMVQTCDGKQNTLPSRLENSEKYPAIFTKTAQGLPGASNNVFVQLGMYWQLHLAYDDGKPMDFYNRFFKLWKSGKYKDAPYDDRVALTAAETAGKNLAEFFTRWGMSLSDETVETLKEYKKETRAIWYLSDQSRRERLGSTGAAEGTLTASAALVKNDAGVTKNKIKVTITPSITGKVQGYEIQRNGKSIAFTSDTAYTDVIGTGNPRTYKYTVVAYDILGNRIGEAEAGEVRVAYDMTVPETAYTLGTNEEGDIVFTLGKETSVSGVKITPAPASGAFTVTVTDGANKTVTARSGDFSKDNLAVDDQSAYLTYFNKPGTTSADTRIWTYDAKTVTVSGVPRGAKVELISYAGDDIAFYEDENGTAAIGVLGEAYGGIPKGTLVVIGTYRGDPVYGGVRVKGEFTVTGYDGAEGKPEERVMPGEIYLFAEVPEDKEVSDISDGLFVFVPNVQQEAALQGIDKGSDCTGVNLLPSRMKLEFYRTDKPNSTETGRVTAETLWLNSPGGSELPEIILRGSN